jgi:hypothetical protein
MEFSRIGPAGREGLVDRIDNQHCSEGIPASVADQFVGQNQRQELETTVLTINFQFRLTLAS